MDIGRLNRLVTLQKRTATQDAAGQPVETWSDIATVRADIRYLSGLEMLRGGASQPEAKVSIRVRYREDLTSAQRLVAGNTTYHIAAVLPDAHGRRHLDLACQVLP